MVKQAAGETCPGQRLLCGWTACSICYILVYQTVTCPTHVHSLAACQQSHRSTPETKSRANVSLQLWERVQLHQRHPPPNPHSIRSASQGRLPSFTLVMDWASLLTLGLTQSLELLKTCVAHLAPGPRTRAQHLMETKLSIFYHLAGGQCRLRTRVCLMDG